MRKRICLCFLLLAVAASVAFGAGAREKINLSLMHFHTKESKDADAETFYAMIEKFQAKNPQIVLDMDITDIDSFYMKIKTLAAANELPDIFPIRSSMVNTLAQNGLIKPLNAELAKDQKWRDGFVEGAFGDFRRGEDIYGIPWAIGSTSLVYYNTAIFAEAGIKKFPETWTEFKTAIKKLKDKGYIPIALGNKGKWVAESCILSTLGDRFTGTEWFYRILERKGAKFTDAEFVKALAALQELAEIGAFNPDMNSLDANQMKTLYFNKKAAMFIEGHWAINSIMEKAPSDVIKATRLSILPAVPGGKGDAHSMSSGSGMGFQINPALKGAKREAALSVIKAVICEEAATIAIEKNGTPVYRPGRCDQSKLSPLKVEYMELTQKTKFTPVYDLHLSPPIIEVMSTGMQELLLGIITPQKLAERIQQEYEREY